MSFLILLLFLELRRCSHVQSTLFPSSFCRLEIRESISNSISFIFIYTQTDLGKVSINLYSINRLERLALVGNQSRRRTTLNQNFEENCLVCILCTPILRIRFFRKIGSVPQLTQWTFAFSTSFGTQVHSRPHAILYIRSIPKDARKMVGTFFPA